MPVVLGASQSARLRGRVVDEYGSPVPSVGVEIQSQAGQTSLAYTDVAGAFQFSPLEAGEYRLSLNKAGFFRLIGQLVRLNEGENEVSLTLNHETELREEVEVYSSSESIKPLETSHGENLIAREIRDIPVPNTHDLRSSLQTMPEVVRDNSGQMHVAGGRVGETQYLLDGFDIGDPVTGDLLARVNVDSVREADVESGRYSVQYANASAGVLALDTTMGDDRWRASANNFVPGITAQRGLHLGSWYPRLALSGPLRKERAWFSDSLSIQRTLSLVKELPRNADSVSQWSGDNMLRVQVNLAPRNILQGSFLYNQRKASNLGLGPFSPSSTTRNSRDYRSFFSIKEQLWSGRYFYELGVAADLSHSEMLPHGDEPFVVNPNGSAGNYFESLRQKTRRWQGFASVTMPSRRWHGTHDLQLGFNAERIAWKQSAERRPIEVLRINNSLAQQTAFSGPPKFRIPNDSIGGYINDVWSVAKTLVLQFGLREDWEQVLRHATPSPRVSANFLPSERGRTKITAAWGVFLQPVTLSYLGPAYGQQRSDLFYGLSNNAPIFGPITSRFILPETHLKQPRYYTTSLGWEQEIGRNTQAKVNFTRRTGRLGLAYEATNPGLPENIFVLQNNRRDRYRSIQISLRHSFNDKAEMSANYTRSYSRTNRIFDYSLGTLVFSPQESGPLDWDTPNRFISSGWTPIPIWNLFLSYFFEYRSGFPFSTVNEQQQLVGPANHMRFPDYSSFNLGIEKRIRLLSRRWAVRLTILNITGHSNPDSVINNIDSPDFMRFAGGQRRALNARLRLVG